MKYFLFLILICSVSFFSIAAQTSTTSKGTYEVVSADGTKKNVSVEEANAGVTDRLKEMRDKQEQERVDRRTEKYTLKTVSRIGISLLIVLGGVVVAFMRKRKIK